RYLVPLLPILGLALASGLRGWRRRGRALRAALLGAASLAVAWAAVIHPALQYRHAHPVRSLLPAVDWTRYLPSWLTPDDRTWPLTGVLAAVGLAFLWAGRRSARQAVEHGDEPGAAMPGPRGSAAGAQDVSRWRGQAWAGVRLGVAGLL